MINRSISLFDLCTYPDVKKAIQNSDKKTFEEALFYLGVDLSLPYEIIDCEHHPLKKKDNTAWFGGLVVGTERSDSQWLKSGNATWECIVENTRDPSLRADLKQIGATGCSDKTWGDEQTAKQVAKEERKRGI